MTALRQLHESLTKACHTSAFLVRELREAHGACNLDTHEGRIAERALLGHIEDAAKLRNALAFYATADGKTEATA